MELKTKAAIFMFLLINSLFLFTIISCTEEEYLSTCQMLEGCSPTQVQPIEDICLATGYPSGPFCQVVTRLWNYCTFKDYCLTRSNIGRFAHSLNEFWEDVINLLDKQTYNEQAFLKSVQNLINQNVYYFKPAMIALSQSVHLCSIDSPITVGSFIYGILPYVEDLGYSCQGDQWEYINDYIDILGLSSQQICTILNENISELNEALYLVDSGTITGSLNEALHFYPECGFDQNGLNPNAPENIRILMDYWTNSTQESCQEWDQLITAIIQHEFQILLKQTARLIADIIEQSNDLSIIQTIETLLPVFVSLMVDEDMNQCP